MKPYTFLAILWIGVFSTAFCSDPSAIVPAGVMALILSIIILAKETN